MIDPYELMTNPEFERKIRTAFCVQDPSQIFIDHLQKDLARRFRGKRGLATRKQTPWHDKFKIALPSLVWGGIACILVLILIWGIRTLIPKSEPAQSIPETPSPFSTPTLFSQPTQEEVIGGMIPVPVIIGTPIPAPLDIINPVNAAQISLLASWGGWMTSAIWAPDGSSFVLGSATGIYIFDASTFEKLAAIGVDSNSYDLAYSPDAKTLTVASTGGLHIYDGKTYQKIQTLDPGTSYNLVAYSPDGTRLAAECSGPSIKVWDIASGKVLNKLIGNYGSYLTRLEFSPDGEVLVISSEVNPVTLWAVNRGQESYSNDAVYTSNLVFSPDGKMLAAGLKSGQVKLLDSSNGQELRTLTGQFSRIVGLVFSPDGKKLASSADKYIRLWDTSTGDELQTFIRQGPVTSLAFLPDSDTLLFTADNEPITLWNISRNRQLRSFGDTTQGGTLLISPDGRTALFYDYYPEAIKLFDIANGNELHSLTSWWVQATGSVAFSPDGRIVAVSMATGSIKLLEARDGQVLGTLTGHTSWVQGLTFSPDGTILASASTDGTARLWDTTTGKQLLIMNGAPEPGWGPGGLPSIDFSPDGKLVAFAGSNGQVMLWDAINHVELQPLGEKVDGAPDGAVSAVRFSHGGETLAAGYANHGFSGYPAQFITLWEPTSGRKLLSIDYIHANVSSLEFSPNGKTLAVGYFDAKVALLEVASGRKLCEASFPWNDAPYSIAYTPGGEVLAVGSYLGTIALLDATSCDQLVTLTQTASSLAFSPDGNLLISVSSDGAIHWWGVNNSLQYPATGEGIQLLPTITSDHLSLPLENSLTDTVQSGDSLFSNAQKIGATQDTLQDLNALLY